MEPSHSPFDLPADFDGHVRLFPLPNLVMFPHVLQPLHIFEPRYCEMLLDAMADDRLLTMALLAPGWQTHYGGRPPVAPIVCIGRVVAHTPVEHRHNILLMGLRRARIVRELPPRRSFRQAEVQLVDDVYALDSDVARTEHRRRLLQEFHEAIPQTRLLEKQLQHVLGEQVDLGILTDVVAFALNLDLALKQQLLSEPDVDRRAARLLECMSSRAATPDAAERGSFPPDFSDN